MCIQLYLFPPCIALYKSHKEYETLFLCYHYDPTTILHMSKYLYLKLAPNTGFNSNTDQQFHILPNFLFYHVKITETMRWEEITPKNNMVWCSKINNLSWILRCKIYEIIIINNINISITCNYNNSVFIFFGLIIFIYSLKKIDSHNHFLYICDLRRHINLITKVLTYYY